MPKFKVTTDQGTFQVELDREPESQDQLQGLVMQHLAGPSAQAGPGMPSLTPQVAPQGQGQPLPPETTFTPGPELPKEESTFTKLARQPSELLGQIPYVGGVAKNLVPSTPAGWGGLAGVTAASLLAPEIAGPVAVGKYGPALIRAGAAALGGAAGSMAGGETEPLEIGKEAALSAGGQLGGEAVGKVAAKGGEAIFRQLKGGTTALLKDYGKKLADLIPDIDPAKFTPTKFFDVVLGGKGHQSLGKMYQEGVDEIASTVGPNAFIQDPTVSRIIGEYLPKSKMASNLPTITQPLTAQGATAPAHLVLGGAQEGQPVSIANAIKAAQEIGAASREMSTAKLRTPSDVARMRDMRQANEELRQAIVDNLDNMAPGMGQKYREINDAFRKGSTVLDLLKDNAESIFGQGVTQPKINAAALARVHNLALDELNRLGPAGEALASASRRGAVPGAGDVSLKVPGMGMFFGGGGVSSRLSARPLSIPIPSGPSGGPAINPLLSGAAGQTVVDLLRSNRSDEDKRKMLEQLGLTR